MKLRRRLFRSLFSYVIGGYTLCIAAILGVYTWILATEVEYGRRAPFDVRLDADAAAFASLLRHDNGIIDLTYLPPELLTHGCAAVYTEEGQLILATMEWRHLSWDSSRFADMSLWRDTVQNVHGERMRYAIMPVRIPRVSDNLFGATTPDTPLEAYVVSAALYEPVYNYILARKGRMAVGIVGISGFLFLCAIVTARISLRPVRRLVARVNACTPETGYAALRTEDLPHELAQIGDAINNALERQYAALEAERAFTAAAAHELRSPVADIAARAHMVRTASSLPPDLADECDALIAATQRAQSLSGRLLLLARLDRAAHGETFTTAPCDLNEIVEDVCAACADAAERKHMKIVTHTLPNAVIDAHEEWVLRAVYNVLMNAIKYAPEGTEITVYIEKSADGSRCAISVLDQGVGIPLAERAQVTRKFYRMKDTRKKEGSGLGLALVSDVMRAHGGELILTDGPERKGLRVTLNFPVKRVAPRRT